ASFSHISLPLSLFFSFKKPYNSAMYTLSLHDALPISGALLLGASGGGNSKTDDRGAAAKKTEAPAALITDTGGVDDRSFNQSARSEEHTSELQSRFDLVCRLLLEKKKEKYNHYTNNQV